jgi:malonyl-CoA/methylmalonyl-CoA synthetase
MDALSEAWHWRSDDRILHTLPLHHIHGLVNGLLCAHYNGASVEFLNFSAPRVWRQLIRSDATVFMGVPTMYAHLIRIYETLDADKQLACRDAASRLRLAVCGSSACPLSVMREWREISGQVRLMQAVFTSCGY